MRIEKEVKEEKKTQTVEVTKTFRLPGTDIIIEKGDILEIPLEEAEDEKDDSEDKDDKEKDDKKKKDKKDKEDDDSSDDDDSSEKDEKKKD